MPLTKATSLWGSVRAVAAPAHRRAGRWLFSFGDAALCHGPRPWTLPLLCTASPPSSPCGSPSRQDIWGEEARDAYKRRGSTLEIEVPNFLVVSTLGSSHLPNPRSE